MYKKFVETIPSKKELQKALGQAEDALDSAQKEIEKLRTRKQSASERIVEITNSLTVLSAERRKALVDERETAGLDAKINAAMLEASKQKELGDGLTDVLADKRPNISELQDKVKARRQAVEKHDLYALYDQYNAAAEPLAEIVKAIYEKRQSLGMELNNISEGGVLKEYEASVFACIPKLKTEEDQADENKTSYYNSYRGPNGYFWRQYINHEPYRSV
jgi:hypothetical protein